MNKIGVIIIDHEETWIKWLGLVLEDERNIDIIGKTKKIEDGIKLVHRLKPDITIIGPCFENKPESIHITNEITTSSGSRVLLVTDLPDDVDTILRTIDAGAMGYIIKNDWFIIPDAIRVICQNRIYYSDILINSIITGYLTIKEYNNQLEKDILRGKLALTQRQREILELLDNGYSQEEVAVQLCMATQSLKNHLSNIRKIIGVNKTKKAVNIAKELDLI